MIFTTFGFMDESVSDSAVVFPAIGLVWRAREPKLAPLRLGDILFDVTIDDEVNAAITGSRRVGVLTLSSRKCNRYRST